LPSAVGFIVGSTVAPRFVHRLRPSVVLGWALIAGAAGLALLTRAGVSTGLDVIVVGSVVISLALSPVFTLTTELIVGSAPPERAGAASGISETGAELGGALGIAILGSIGTAVYRAELASALPAGVPDALAEVARDTLGGAVETAGQLSGRVGEALLVVARTAFVDGLHLVATISAAMAVAAAVVVWTVLRNVPAGSPDEAAPVIEVGFDGVTPAPSEA
jgi:DHA2 family multidrug resistance protein-like MFS transporter